MLAPLSAIPFQHSPTPNKSHPSEVPVIVNEAVALQRIQEVGQNLAVWRNQGLQLTKAAGMAAETEKIKWTIATAAVPAASEAVSLPFPALELDAMVSIPQALKEEATTCSPPEAVEGLILATEPKQYSQKAVAIMGILLENLLFKKCCSDFSLLLPLIETYAKDGISARDIRVSKWWKDFTICMPGLTYMRQQSPSSLFVSEGRFEYVQELKHTSLVEGKIVFSTGGIQVGKWAYVPELKIMCLVEGKFIWAADPNGRIDEGKWAYVPELNGMRLVEGKIIWAGPNGPIEEGKSAYVPELKIMCLVEGKFIWAADQNGRIDEGKWAYVRELNGMRLVEGKLIWADGRIDVGKRAYVPELNAMCLVEGKIMWADGRIEEGKWAYDPGLRGMILVESKITLPSGLTDEGKRAYDLGLRGMRLVEGKIINPEGLRSRSRSRLKETI